MSRTTRWLDRKLYPDYGRGWDTWRFRSCILDRLEPGHRLLDLGAGRGVSPAMNFKGHAAFVAGVDPDPVVRENPYLDEARILDLADGTLPFGDASFDIVISNSVLEHVDDPQAFLKEAQRVLRPGGILLVKTPNRRHYFALIARLTPQAFHTWINEKRGRPSEDTFPTLYRCNTPRELISSSTQAGFEVVSLETWEGRPEYLRLAALPYLLGFLYERGVNASRRLAGLRAVLVAVLRKPPGSKPTS